MSAEIELISDEQGLVLIGDPSDVERFLESQALPASRPTPPRLQKLIATGGTAAKVGGDVSANSGRWIKLTEESAAKVKAFGLTPTKTPGVSHAMIGKPGASQSWLQVVQGPRAMLTNPAALANVGALMTQMALQQTMDDIKDYLAAIDEKVDDVLRAQKDAVIADMVGVGMVIDEAMTIRQHTGHVSDVTWSKVQGTSQTLAATQAYALRQLDALVEKVEAKAKIGDLAESVETAEPKAREWLAVIARSFQLQDAIAVLEVDRVLDAGTNDLDQHRAGVKAARERRLHMITTTTDNLLDRLGLALGISNSKVLFHPGAAAAIARSGTRATESVIMVHEMLGIESDRKPFESMAWKGAARQLVRSARDTGTESVDSARQLGDRARGAAIDRGDRLAAAYSKRSAEWRARSNNPASDSTDKEDASSAD